MLFDRLFYRPQPAIDVDDLAFIIFVFVQLSGGYLYALIIQGSWSVSTEVLLTWCFPAKTLAREWIASAITLRLGLWGLGGRSRLRLHALPLSQRLIVAMEYHLHLAELDLSAVFDVIWNIRFESYTVYKSADCGTEISYCKSVVDALEKAVLSADALMEQINIHNIAVAPKACRKRLNVKSHLSIC